MTVTDPIAVSRVGAFKKVCDEFCVDLDDNYCGAEDANMFINGDEPIGKWCVVTRSGEWVYAVAWEGDKIFSDAVSRAVANIVDDIFAETPVAIVNLDTGETWSPDYEQLRWTRELKDEHESK